MYNRRYTQPGFPGGGAFIPAGRRGPGYRDPYKNHALIRMALILIQQIAVMEHKPPITLFLSAILCAVHFSSGVTSSSTAGGVVAMVNGLLGKKRSSSGSGLNINIPSLRSACLNPAKIIQNRQWSRLLWSPLLHADDLHLFYNVSSFLWKGAQLEPSLGIIPYTALLLELAIVSQLLYCILAVLSFPLGPSINSCAVGFSGVLFGLKVLLTYNAPGWSSLMGIQLPTKYTAWAELFVAQLLTPGVSFWGHAAGIAAGLIHVYFVRTFVQHYIRGGRGFSGSRGAAGGGGNRRGNPNWQNTTPRTWGN